MVAAPDFKTFGNSCDFRNKGPFMSTPLIEIYTKFGCGYCTRAKALFDAKGVAYEEISVDGKPEVRADMAKKAGRTSVPQIWIGTTHVGGCDDLFALERAGKLDALLA